VDRAPEPTPSTAAPSRSVYTPPRRCDCENSTCQLGHPLGGCQRTAAVKSTHGGLCIDCAEFMPEEYLLRDRLLAYTPEPWVARTSRDRAVLIMRDPLASANDVIACVMFHRDGSTAANAKLLLAAPRLLCVLSKLHAALADRWQQLDGPLAQAQLDAGELLAEMEARP
jgi:hypothetical protein